MNSKIYNLFCKNNYKKIINRETALIFEDKKISYFDLHLKSQIICENLSKDNKLLNKKIIVALENTEKYIYLLLAASKLNISLILVNPEIKITQLNKIKKDSKLMIVDKDNLKYFQQSDVKMKFLTIERLVLKKKNLNKIVNKKKRDYIINFSSGSTGLPKEIIYTQELKINRAKQLWSNILGKKENKIINYAPIYHSLGQRLVFSSLLASNQLILMRKFNFIEWEKNIEKYKVTILFPISSHLNLLVNSLIKKKKRFKSVKKIIASSSQVSQKTKKIILTKYKNIFYDTYGAAEIAFASILRPTDKISKNNSVGKVLNDVNIYIHKKNKKIKYGEICCNTKFLSRFSRKEKNNSQIFYKKKFFKTGDLGYLDKDKYLYFVSRSKDIIIKSGMNIIPKNIEDIILKDKLIKKCAVIGVKDEIFGETPIAICEMIKSENNLKRKFEENLSYRLSKHLMPAKFFYVTSLKFLSTGKINKIYYKKKYSKLIINKDKTRLFI